VDLKTTRTILTILMYVGVLVFLSPYFLEHARHAALLMLAGACMAVICGLLRCYCTEDKP
jgi:ABC-type uncharacterized transport system permease subunit